MNDGPISISVSDDERAFSDGELAAGRYANEEDLLHAGLAVLQQQSLATGGFDEAGGAPYLHEDEDAEALRQHLAESAASGVSARGVREIMVDVKAKLRADGTL